MKREEEDKAIESVLNVLSQDQDKLVAQLGSKRLPARFSIQRLHENLRRLRLRYHEYLEAEKMIDSEPSELEKAGVSLADAQLNFVDKLESLHQQNYSTISALILVLNYVGISGTKAEHPKRSVQKFLTFVKALPLYNKNFHDPLDLLLKSVQFRAECIDHPQGRPAYNWLTMSMSGHGYLIYYTPDGGTPTGVTPFPNDPSHPDFRPPLDRCVPFYVSPNSRESYYAVLLLVRVLLNRK